MYSSTDSYSSRKSCLQLARETSFTLNKYIPELILNSPGPGVGKYR